MIRYLFIFLVTLIISGGFNFKSNYDVKTAFTSSAAAPDFTLSDIHGNKVSLSDFKGKVVYMDIWATWCMPCMMEMNKSKSLKEKYKDNKDLVFLYVSIDKNIDKWKSTVKSKGFTGVHVNSKEGKEESITEKYKATYIPRYILIDREGNIVDEDAKRPSDAALVDDLENALKK